ncbi:putative bifunctional diguanylate cyclase/phosphodiesterase [Ferrimonas lipolytica]|uniref:EAL domain-containing protein n=1 Tax=Ferrimonas lipolytica TaxID=2724191 RepID=A0A6H1UGS1_9GAMM|nr:EAL domain-containing protein [Ferrimonas lipolytica]QIZ77800.1 EAL domain-containing protein [Ferrimonas lipolytica]
MNVKISEMQGSAADLNSFCLALQKLIGTEMPAENMVLCDMSGAWPKLMWIKDNLNNVIPTNLENGVTHYLMRHGRSAVLHQMEVLSLINRGQVSLIGNLPHSWMGIIVAQQQQLVASVILQTYDSYRFTNDDKKLLDLLTPAIASALAHLQSQHKQLESKIAEQAERKSQKSLQVMCELTELCQSEMPLDTLYGRFHELLSQLMPATHFVIALKVGEDTIDFVYTANENLEDFTPRQGYNGITEYSMQQAKPLLLTREQMQALFDNGEVTLLGRRSACVLAAPMRFGGEVLGSLVLQDYHDDHAYGVAERQLLGYVAHHIANVIGTRRTQEQLANNQLKLEQAVKQRTAELEHEITERRRIESQLRHDTLHDDLTSLPNRTMIMERLNKVLAVRKRDKSFQYALLFLDLNRFKVINDSLGHLTGDHLLRQVAQRLSNCLRGFDTVARLGGDEFAILVEHLNSPEDAINTANRIQATLSRPFYIDNEEVYSGASIGIAFGDEQYQEPSELLRDADVAMYRAKDQHSKKPVVFDASMREAAQQRMTLENELQRALEFEQFEVYYQPTWTLESGKLCGFEALARWRHPTRGLLLPEDFLPMMEENRQIIELDRWVLQTATKHFAQWLTKYPRLESIGVSINLCSEWFSRNDSFDVIIKTLATNKLAAKHLLLEITEKGVQHHQENAAQLLKQLQNIGVRSIMDDFGTGYSSLSHLHQLPIEVVKIDSSFISRMNHCNRSAAVVSAIFTLCNELGISVNAEGVERLQQIEQLRDLGCHYGQGFHLGRPLPANQISDFLAGKPTDR